MSNPTTSYPTHTQRELLALAENAHLYRSAAALQRRMRKLGLAAPGEAQALRFERVFDPKLLLDAVRQRWMQELRQEPGSYVYRTHTYYTANTRQVLLYATGLGVAQGVIPAFFQELLLAHHLVSEEKIVRLLSNYRDAYLFTLRTFQETIAHLRGTAAVSRMGPGHGYFIFDDITPRLPGLEFSAIYTCRALYRPPLIDRVWTFDEFGKRVGLYISSAAPFLDAGDEYSETVATYYRLRKLRLLSESADS